MLCRKSNSAVVLVFEVILSEARVHVIAFSHLAASLQDFQLPGGSCHKSDDSAHCRDCFETSMCLLARLLLPTMEGRFPHHGTGSVCGICSGLVGETKIKPISLGTHTLLSPLPHRPPLGGKADEACSQRVGHLPAKRPDWISQGALLMELILKVSGSCIGFDVIDNLMQCWCCVFAVRDGTHPFKVSSWIRLTGASPAQLCHK